MTSAGATAADSTVPGREPRQPLAGVGLTHFAGRAGDHNDRAMVASAHLVAALGELLATSPAVIGTPEPALSTGWAEGLSAAMPTLQAMQQRLTAVFDAGQVPVTASSRCAVALATLPVVAAARPDAVVVWFDSHADINTPDSTTTGYLGGLAYSGPMGMWDSGLGSGLAAENAVLVGARDIDPAEQDLLDQGVIKLVRVGPGMADELRAAVAGRPVYLHLDCDVLEPGIVATDYQVPDGMTLEDLHACAAVLAESEIVGLELAELEADGDPALIHGHVQGLLTALRPVFMSSWTS
ncbi:arginase family protein [Georgenia wangjunii]|uniref:arginase family protein n=1 Tax=Georgenia wangjunii TaxID=3117730 RepID=UPI002F264D8B